MSNTEVMTARLKSLDSVKEARAAVATAQGAVKSAEQAHAEATSAVNTATTAAKRNSAAAAAKKALTELEKARAAATEAARTAAQMRETYPTAAALADAQEARQQALEALERATDKAEVIKTTHAAALESLKPLRDAEKAAQTALDAEKETLAGTLAQMRADRETRDADLKAASEEKHAEQERKTQTALEALNRAETAYKLEKEKVSAYERKELPDALEAVDKLHKQVKELEREEVGLEIQAEQEERAAFAAVYAVAHLKETRPGISANALEFAARYAGHVVQGSVSHDKANRALAGALHSAIHELLWVAMQLNPAQRQVIADFAVGVGRDGDTRAADPEQMKEQPAKEIVGGKERARAAFGRETDGKKAVKRADWNPEADAVRIGLKLTTRYRVPGEEKLGSRVSYRGQYEQAKELIKRETGHAAALTVNEAPALTAQPATQPAE